MQTTNKNNSKVLTMECGCGRSPTGKCIGWHALSEEEYQNELSKIQAEESEMNAPNEED